MAVTYLVTGGTGFLGRAVVRTLLARPGVVVRVLARHDDAELARLGAQFVRGSVLDPDVTRVATDGCAGVFHLAGKVERDPKAAHTLYELHVTGTRTVLEAAADMGVRRVVVASTSGTVGVTRDGRSVPDDSAPHVTELAREWPYYLSKIYAESTAVQVARRRQLDVVLVRPTLLLGPGDRERSSTGDVVNFLYGRIPLVPSGGLSFVDVRDAADAFVAAMERGRGGATYLLGACNLTFGAFFERLERASGVAGPRVRVPDAAALAAARALQWSLRALGRRPDVDAVSVRMAQHFWYIDWSAAVRDLDFAPRDPDTTLRDTVTWLRAYEAMNAGLEPDAPVAAATVPPPEPPRTGAWRQREAEARARFDAALHVLVAPMKVSMRASMPTAAAMASTVATTAVVASTVSAATFGAPVEAPRTHRQQFDQSQHAHSTHYTHHPHSAPSASATLDTHGSATVDSHPALDVAAALPAWGPHGGRSRIVYESLGDGPGLETMLGGAVDALTSAVGGKGVAATANGLKRSARGLGSQMASGKLPGVPGWFKPKKGD
ncbi:MAG: NAD-dependent epimerase/dehydratase family protein [Myxococcales bacterium]|nr:NAD-dependent epimerase/dehydratase family protein [Myxococcales bacterium]